MALWENAQAGNVFFLPSAKLMVTLYNEGQMQLFQMTDSKNWDSLNRPVTEAFLETTQWYRADRRPLFVYFDSLSDLVTSFRTLDFKAKRKQIREYMDRHEEEQLAKWKALFRKAGIG